MWLTTFLACATAPDTALEASEPAARLPAYGGCTFAWAVDDDLDGEVDTEGTWTYDAEERLVLERWPRGNHVYATTWAYDDQDCLLAGSSSETYGSDEWGERATYVCDAAGYPVSAELSTYENELVEAAGSASIVNTEIDGLRVLAVEDWSWPDGSALLARTSWDWVDGLVVREDGYEEQTQVAHWEYVYDGAGHWVWAYGGGLGGVTRWYRTTRDEHGRELRYEEAADPDFADLRHWEERDWETDRYAMTALRQGEEADTEPTVTATGSCSESWPWTCNWEWFDVDETGAATPAYNAVESWSCP